MIIRDKTLPLALATILCLASAAGARAGCAESGAIAEAFAPNVQYYAAINGLDGTGAMGELDAIAGQGLDCDELYGQYQFYLNDLATQSHPSFGFQKW